MPEFRDQFDLPPVKLTKADVEDLAILLISGVPERPHSFEFTVSAGNATYRANSISELKAQNLPEQVTDLTYRVIGWTSDNTIDRGVSLNLHRTTSYCQVHSLDEVWFKGKISQVNDFFKKHTPWYAPLFANLAFLSGIVQAFSFVAAILFVLNGQFLFTGAAVVAYIATQVAFNQFLKGHLFPRSDIRHQSKSLGLNRKINHIAAIVGILVAIIQVTLWGIDLYKWAQPSVDKLSPSDLLVIDQNPTNIEIVQAEKLAVDKDGESIFFTLRNNSNVTAKNVRVSFYNYKGDKSPYHDRFTNDNDGIDIPAGENKSYKVAFISDYEKFFNPENPGAKLLKVSTKINSEKPFELQAIACGVENGEISPCSFNSSGRSTIVDIKYRSIFGQTYQTLTQFYNIFLDGEISYLPKQGV